MLDENLPSELELCVYSVPELTRIAFLLKPSHDKPKQISTFFYSQYGAEYEPVYVLRHPDPESQDSKNRYAAALYDAHISDVLFGEVLLVPEWTQPTLSVEALRLNGGVPTPPEPILPAEFAIQLYNPDQQIIVRQKHGSWGSNPSWEFEMPQQTFRQPSASALDRSQHDPAGSDITPKIAFKWKKDSKLSKDLACFLSGKSTNPDGTKKKNKEPDITVAIFKGLKEVTLYEPNLQRVEIEDMKGFEVALLLGAAVIRDVYFGNMKETFNIAGAATSPRPSPPLGGLQTYASGALNTSSGPTPGSPARDPRIPPTDPRTQWEIDAETARLKRLAMEEERERRRKVETEQKQIKKMLEAEEKERRRRQAEIDKETERLQRLYGQEEQQARPSLPARQGGRQHHSDQHVPHARPHTQHGFYPTSWGASSQASHGPYLGVPGNQAAQSGFFGAQSDDGQRVKPKKGFFGFVHNSDADKLQRKRSSQF
jgi:hypothetical protein